MSVFKRFWEWVKEWHELLGLWKSIDKKLSDDFHKKTNVRKAGAKRKKK
jgi:hypothetical protein